MVDFGLFCLTKANEQIIKDTGLILEPSLREKENIARFSEDQRSALRNVGNCFRGGSLMQRRTRKREKEKEGGWGVCARVCMCVCV